ncbi:BMP family ABC transporter substrate-binding protein [Desertimonas flava]|uniref:BMP family ABC transporter substrate-binding protein n=1 Tax=Desertimonas flava TaxID=2064846 RepID=UPI000E343513|nr:BMP family ABC transporter substrate-binding protein [Desertimonas flava]
MRSKPALALAATVVTAGLTTSAAVSATTAPPGSEAAEGSAAAEGSSSYITLEDACASYEGLQAPDGFRVNLVTDIGKVDDGTFNQFAYDGMTAANECFGIEDTSFIETVAQSDYASNIATSLESNPNVVVTVGFLLTDDTKAAAEANPDVSFIGVDQYLDEYPANMAGEQFAEDQAGYLAGVIAASLSQSGVIGVVGGLETVPPVVKLVNGYTVGAQSVNPDITVLSVYSDSFTDPASGASTANQFIGEGADVIFGAGGQTGSGGVSAAAEQGVWGIGVDQDEYFTTFAGGTAAGSEYLASSAVKRVDLSTFQLIAAAVAGEFEGGLYVGDASNNQIAFAPAHDADVPAEVTAAAEAALAGLADGSITTGICAIDGLFIGEGSACDGGAAEGSEAPAEGSEAPATTGA